MLASVSWDQTLVGLLLSVATSAVAFGLATRVLRRQELRREARQRRDALDQVLAVLTGPAGEYLADPSLDYPQRDMVELERRALQAQVLFFRDLELQRALRDIAYPERFREAAETVRRASAQQSTELVRLGERGS